jgi:hypothetical protein
MSCTPVALYRFVNGMIGEYWKWWCLVPWSCILLDADMAGRRGPMLDRSPRREISCFDPASNRRIQSAYLPPPPSPLHRLSHSTMRATVAATLVALRLIQTVSAAPKLSIPRPDPFADPKNDPYNVSCQFITFTPSITELTP